MKIAFSILLLCLAGLPLGVSATEPSTPAQCQRFVEIVKGLEKDAFSDDARTDRSWALTFINNAPDIHVEVNLDTVRELVNADIPNRPAIQNQFILGASRYVVEHPDQAADKVAVHEAAFVSCLAVYRQAVALNPSNQIVIFDSFIQKERDGTLHDYVAGLFAAKTPEENKTP